MNFLVNIMIGYFFGFTLGVGCALAVMYTIYTNGYKKAIEHSLMKEKPARYESMLQSVENKLGR